MLKSQQMAAYLANYCHGMADRCAQLMVDWRSGAVERAVADIMHMLLPAAWPGSGGQPVSAVSASALRGPL